MDVFCHKETEILHDISKALSDGFLKPSTISIQDILLWIVPNNNNNSNLMVK